MTSIVLSDFYSRTRAVKAVRDAPDGWVLEIKDKRSSQQNEKFHSMLNDIARQCKHLGANFSPDDWKRLCVDAYRKECLKPGADPRIAEYFQRNGFRFAPALDGSGVVALGDQTRNFPKYIATGFIEWLMAWGSEREVKWSDPTQVPIEAYK